ncbi:unnamed protein product [Arctogadus glacialis]
MDVVGYTTGCICRPLPHKYRLYLHAALHSLPPSPAPDKVRQREEFLLGLCALIAAQGGRFHCAKKEGEKGNIRKKACLLFFCNTGWRERVREMER